MLLVKLLAIKTSPGSLLARTLEYPARRRSLHLRLLPDPIEPPVTFPNLHQSLPDHLCLSSSPVFVGNLAATEVTRVPRHRPSPGRSPAEPPPPIDL
jgi:hypothetical protein